MTRLRISRRSVLTGIAGAGFGTALLRFPGEAAEFSYKWATGVNITHPIVVGALAAADKINRDTSGRVEFKMFPNNQLGSDSSMILQVRQGALEMQTVADTSLGQGLPLVGISATPFVFSSLQQSFGAFDGGLGSLVADSI